MAHIEVEKIKGYYVGPNRNRELVCIDCLDSEDQKGLGPDDFLTEDNMNEHDFYFCDRCKEPL